MSELKRETPQPPLFDDAQETVEAIHRGIVDAVVVMKGSEGPQIIMLQGADEPYRVLVERMSEGALTFGPDGDILYVNGRLCELTGYPAERLVHRDIATLFEGEAPTLAPNVSLEASLLRNDDTSLPVSVWAGPFSNSRPTPFLCSRRTVASLMRAGWLRSSLNSRRSAAPFPRPSRSRRIAG